MRINWIALLLLSFVSTGFAQEISPATITSTGEATEVIVPTHVEFRFSASFEEDSLAESAKDANAFQKHLTEAIKTLKYNGINLSFRAPRLDSISSRVVRVEGNIQFPIPRDVDQESQVVSYATLCDSIAAIGESTQAAFHRPNFFVSDTELVEQESLKRATENALYKADAIAQILNSQIYEVQSVKIVELRWHTDKSDPETAPGMDRIACSAKVSLTYLHQP